jgi:uncharacterized membrane protein YbhN (UPF0104 family)
MIRILQVITVIIIFAVIPITAADYYWGNGFLNKFLIEQSLPIMGTILAIYIAAAASFLSIVVNHEKGEHNSIFKGTVTELKYNIIIVIAIFVIHLFMMVATPPAKPENMHVILFLKGAKVFTFILYIFALYKLSHLLFGVRTVINSLKNNP